MRCTNCGTEGTAGKKFCAECGSPLPNRCAKCGSDNALGAKFCADCGVPLVSAAPAANRVKVASASVLPFNAATQATALEGERKTVTALFADIKGSMDLIEDLDPEEARAIVDPALKLMIDAADHYGGYIVQSTGDGIFALFGAPIAHEDHPQRAVFAGLRMQEDLKRYADKLRERGQPPLSVRVGVNGGEVVVRSIQTDEGHTEYTPIGHSIGLASRLQTLAAPGSVMIGESVRKFVEGYFQLKALGASRIKGVSEPVNVYEVTGLGPLRTRLERSAGRGLTKFVGRNREIEAMKAAADQAKSGHGQIVAAMAEPGVGKSRLFFEFKAISQSGWMMLETFSVSHGKASASLPVIDLLHGYFKITGSDDERMRREKVNGKVLTLDRSLEDTIPYLFGLLGISEDAEHYRNWEQTLDRLDEHLLQVQKKNPLAQMDAQIRKRRTLDAIKRLLMRESLNQPLMVMFEDLHWIDQETQALLNLLADSIGTAKILLLVNYRPEYSHHWGSKTYYTQLRLDPLGKESADEMLSALLGDGVELAPLKRLIVEKTEGNPFFMEESAQVLLDEGALVRDGTTVRLTRQLGELKIPPTVQGILAARIDRLPQDAKDLLQTLAVIGREFPLSLIRVVVPKSDDELDRLLNDLQLGEFLYEQPAVGDTEYTFKHALTQEVAYNSVLIERRKQLHERIGDALEALFASSLDDQLAALAHHFGRGNNPGKAVDYFGRAAQQSLQRAAYEEAKGYLEAGLEYLRALPESPDNSRAELRIQLGRGQLLQSIVGMAAPEAIACLTRARELCTMIGSDADAQLFQVLDGLRQASLFRLEMEKARHLAEELIALAGRLRDPVKSALASGAMGETLWWSGDYPAARRFLEPVLSPGFGDLRGRALQSLTIFRSANASVLVALGFCDQANKRFEEVLAWVQGLGFPNPTGTAFLIACTSDLHRRSPRSALEHSKMVNEISSATGFPGEIATIMNGWALSCLGQVEEGIDTMRTGIAALESTGVLIPTFGLIPLADGYMRIGRLKESAELVDQMLDRVQRTGHRQDEAEVHRLKGALSMSRNTPDLAAAEQSFRKAIEVARNQGAKLYELRATTSLARLLRETNRLDEARPMLSDIYNWFTEGFDSADLKDAKALLNELSG